MGILHLSPPQKTLLGLAVIFLSLTGIAVFLFCSSRRLARSRRGARGRHHSGRPALAVVFAAAALVVLCFGIGAASPRNTLFGPFFWRGTSRAGAVALTFDDGPDPAYTPSVLAILARYQAQATFFMLGERVRLYPALAREVSQAGHAVGSHCEHHVSLLLASPARISREIVQAETAIEQATGRQPWLLRPPYGFHPPLLSREAKRRGYLVVGWSISSQDSASLPAERIARRVLARVRSGSIVLLHDGRGQREETVKALPLILAGLRQRNLRCVTLPQLREETKFAPN